MNQKMRTLVSAAVAGVALFSAQSAMAACSDVPYANLKTAVDAAGVTNTDKGYPLKFWATVVDETGVVCAVYTNGATGAAAGNSEWLGSRVISAQKANTANAFSLDAYTISTANLYTAVKEGSLYGLQHSNPVDASRAYLGNANNFGKANDPLVGKRVGGVNVFGGGLALYKAGKKIGAIGVSGDTSCADHSFAWTVRNNLGFKPSVHQTAGLAGPGTGITTVNFLPDGSVATPLTGAAEGDELILSSSSGSYWHNWSQPGCPNIGASPATLPGVLVE